MCCLWYTKYIMSKFHSQTPRIIGLHMREQLKYLPLGWPSWSCSPKCNALSFARMISPTVNQSRIYPSCWSVYILQRIPPKDYKHLTGHTTSLRHSWESHHPCQVRQRTFAATSQLNDDRKWGSWSKSRGCWLLGMLYARQHWKASIGYMRHVLSAETPNHLLARLRPLPKVNGQDI